MKMYKRKDIKRISFTRLFWSVLGSSDRSPLLEIQGPVALSLPLWRCRPSEVSLIAIIYYTAGL